MHILVTRPIEDCLKLIESLKILGHQVTHCPIIKIKKLSYKEPNYKNYNGIIFTSSNAIDCLDIKKIPKNISCFCVGDTTEKKAKSKGFYQAISAGGNVNTLIELIMRIYDKKSGKLLYISSEFISKELDKDLLGHGYLVDRIINYTSLPVEEISENTLSLIKENKLDAIFVYSEKSAINLKNLIIKYSLVDVMMDSNLFCISKKTSKALEFLKWKKIIIFNPGDEIFYLNKV
jgi:uroporphyrinogen-III synthase